MSDSEDDPFKFSDDGENYSEEEARKKKKGGLKKKPIEKVKVKVDLRRKKD